VARVSWLAARQLHLALAAIPWLGAPLPTQRVPLAGARLLPLQGLFAAGTIARLGAAALGWVLLGRRRGVEAA
jgi:hypothetical protein